MEGPTPDVPPSAAAQARHEYAWAIVRLMLGLAQIVGAAVSLMLLIRTGMHAGSLTAVVLTSLCTTVSVLLFGSRRKAR